MEMDKDIWNKNGSRRVNPDGSGGFDIPIPILKPEYIYVTVPDGSYPDAEVNYAGHSLENALKAGRRMTVDWKIQKWLDEELIEIL